MNKLETAAWPMLSRPDQSPRPRRVRTVNMEVLEDERLDLLFDLTDLGEPPPVECSCLACRGGRRDRPGGGCPLHHLDVSDGDI